MVSVKTKIWFIPTSPRSPQKLRNEITLLAKLDGKNWWERDRKDRLINQLKYAQLLKDSDFFEGAISDKNPDFSARERCRAIWMLGFGYIDDKKILHITPAGKRLIKGLRIEDLFLKQLLKLQFPSWQHGGNRRTAHRYKLLKSGFFPFVETLKIAEKVDGLTKLEIAMFLLPCITKEMFKSAPDRIMQFRDDLEKVRPGRPRKEFIRNNHKEIFSEIFDDEITKGEIATREKPTFTVDSFLNKKMQNSRDYADALVRYFQYTGYFTRSVHRLIISPHRKKEILRILKEMKFKIYDYTDVNKFYNHMGNPDIPYLPYENIPDMKERIKDILKQAKEVINEITILDDSYIPPLIPREPTVVDISTISDYYYLLNLHLRKLRETSLEKNIRKPELIKDILSMYDKILNKEVISPNLFFEWNTWRALLALDDGVIKPNFSLDDQLMPISNAGGRQPDIENYYNEDFVVLTEVTLSSGERQYDTEVEPVTRHIARFQMNNPKKKVFGLFIAPKINLNTCQFFFVYLKHTPFPDAGFITIIPMSLNTFVRFFNVCMKNQCFTKNEFRKILDRLEMLKNCVDNGKDWYEAVCNALEIWMAAQQEGQTTLI